MRPEFHLPAAIAAKTVYEIQEKGLAQGHPVCAWKTEPINNHIDKAIRHLCTAKLIREGNQSPDGENHFKNALCRVVFALCQDLGATKDLHGADRRISGHSAK
jgi:hypothetical protein